MEIKYEVTLDDLVYFNVYHSMNSPTIRKSFILHRFLVPGIYLVIPFLLAYLYPNSLLISLPTFVVLSFLWIAFYPTFVKWRIKKTVTKMLHEGGNAGVIGEQTLVIDPIDIVETNDVKEMKSKWSSVLKVVSTEKSILIYTSSTGAIIIPKRTFVDNDQVEQFTQVLLSYQKGCEV